jgi:hypothetical protein
MTTTNPVVDAARVELLLNELRLPSNPTRKVGGRPASSRNLPSTRWLTMAAAASNGTS